MNLEKLPNDVFILICVFLGYPITSEISKLYKIKKPKNKHVFPLYCLPLIFVNKLSISSFPKCFICWKKDTSEYSLICSKCHRLHMHLCKDCNLYFVYDYFNNEFRCKSCLKKVDIEIPSLLLNEIRYYRKYKESDAVGNDPTVAQLPE